MQQHEKDAIREVIEALVIELGVDSVPDDVDLDSALALLAPDEIKVEETDGPEEEVTESAVEEADETGTVEA